MRLILEDDDGEVYELMSGDCGDECCLRNGACVAGFSGERLPCEGKLDFFRTFGNGYKVTFRRLNMLGNGVADQEDRWYNSLKASNRRVE